MPGHGPVRRDAVNHHAMKVPQAVAIRRVPRRLAWALLTLRMHRLASLDHSLIDALDQRLFLTPLTGNGESHQRQRRKDLVSRPGLEPGTP